MFVLDDLYVSKEVLDYLEQSQEPVLDTPAARKHAQERNLFICELDTARSLVEKEGQRICALSEMHLEDAKRVCNSTSVRAIDLCKDKAAFRRTLKPLYPNYVFEEYAQEELENLNPAEVNYPVVIKPSTGFFSLGIYPVFNEDDWRGALEDIAEHSSSWSNVYNASVINDTQFLVESYIEGDEYAIDAYYDDEGRPVVLNIFKHDFAGADDVADRLYYTSKHLIESQLERMQGFLSHANEYLGFKGFPFHAEVRVQSDGVVIPIEFNPLRFAGLCTTDTSFFAYGIKTYEYYLRDKKPDWKTLLQGKDDFIYPMILLCKPGFDSSREYEFDYETLQRSFRKVLALRKTDFAHANTFGFLFPETHEKDWAQEIVPILGSNLEEYISYLE